jgi:hypothetical protein
MPLITYATKNTGDQFTAADANEIKTVVNSNAFNPANTATGTNSVTINARSGVAVFTDAIGFGDTVVFTINNSNITAARQAAFVSLGYAYGDGSEQGTPQLVGYETNIGQINIFIKNISPSVTTNDNLHLSFSI